jgi:hypothetical protein
MNSQQERVLQSFRRVQSWFATYPEYSTKDPTGSPALATQLDALNGIVQRATEFAAEQDTQLAQSLLVSKDEREQRREVLSHHMASIAKVARALRGTIPGIGVLTMPKGNIQSAALITAAVVMARKAEVYASVMAEHGLPTDFARQLENAATKLKESLDARGRARGARAGATRGLESELALGRRVIDILDVALTRALRSQPARLAEWKSVKRVTLKGTAVRGSISGVEVLPTRIESSPTSVEASPTVQEKAA